MKGLLNFSTIIVMSLLLMLGSLYIFSDEGDSYISFNIKGKEFNFAAVEISYDEAESILKIEGSQNDGDDGIILEIRHSGESVTGTYTTVNEEECTVSVWWLEGDDPDTADEYYLTAFGDDDTIAEFTVVVTEYNGDGSIASGTFSGFLYDQSGVKHELTNGRFSGVTAEYTGE
ncbi:MAG: hypothetical protein JW737_04600 [Acidobacteria bacterium]|nr:hypothetical protein [Acidobacteriota bacterium]